MDYSINYIKTVHRFLKNILIHDFRFPSRAGLGDRRQDRSERQRVAVWRERQVVAEAT